MTDYDQHLVDYTVRNISTGDEEEIRVLELTDDEIAGFPDAVRDDVASLIAASLDNRDDWRSTHQDTIVRTLLPYISRRDLFERDYGAWETYVLEGSVDTLAPEDMAATVRHVLHAGVEAAIANWAEGYWSEFDDTTPARDVLAQFGGFLSAWLESVDDDDDPELAKSLLTISNEEDTRSAN